MKKIILPILLIFTGAVSYVAGYVYFNINNETPIIKEREYVMNNEAAIPTQEECFEETETMYMLYPMYGEIWIYESDGSFYDYTGIMLYDLSREEQIDVLNGRKVFNRDELYNFLEAFTS